MRLEEYKHYYAHKCRIKIEADSTKERGYPLERYYFILEGYIVYIDRTQNRFTLSGNYRRWTAHFLFTFIKDHLCCQKFSY